MSVKVGDFVKVTAGLGYPGPGLPVIKGRVVGVEPAGSDDKVDVCTTSGGTWVFWASHLTVLPKKGAR